MNNGRRWINLASLVAIFAAFALILGKNLPGKTGDQLLNVSYDPTRELYQRVDAEFVSDYEKRTGRHITILQSHGGSSRQARSVIDGDQPADVVTLGVFSDVDALRKRGLIADGWADRLPNHSQPYTSTIVFVVRQGNPKTLPDWPDLIKPDVQIVTADPKTSANGKLSILAAWGSVVTRGGSETDARRYLKAFYQHVAEMDPGARTASMTFAMREIGDVQLTWEDAAIRETSESEGKLQIVYPPVSILAEPYVAWVDVNVARRHTQAVAQAYLEFLFTDQAQATIASFGFRPYKDGALRHAGVNLPRLRLFPITAIASNWDDAFEKFFAENGILDTSIGTISK
jgi:sulfate transport system substrate-binding protein